MFKSNPGAEVGEALSPVVCMLPISFISEHQLVQTWQVFMKPVACARMFWLYLLYRKCQGAGHFILVCFLFKLWMGLLL